MSDPSIALIDIDLVREWIIQAGQMALSQQAALNTQTKPDNTLVTDIDEQIENFLTTRISQYYPDHRILAEEGRHHKQNSEFLWIIDPIDGTRAFASGLPVWGISIAVFYREEPVAGIFYMPVTGEVYSSTKLAAFYGDKPIVPREKVDFRDPLAFIAVPSNFHLLYSTSFPRLRSLGSITAHLAYVASGVALAALTRNISIWDIASVLLLLRAANIGLVYLSGKAFRLQILLEGNPSPEPIVVAPVIALDDVRKLIKKK